MSPGRKLIAGNWKMNGLRADATALCRELAQKVRMTDIGCELLVCPPATVLTFVGNAIAGSGILLGGQDCHAAAAGPFTGSISAEMLKDAGCTHVIVGHSERRRGYGERNSDVRAKVAAAWRAGLIAIVCIGETAEDHESGKAREVVVSQLSRSVPDEAIAINLVVAYEPVWAIGSGHLPEIAEIAEVHAAISEQQPSTRILYGGSVNGRNAAEVLAIPNVDGVLVGGASLHLDEFWAIANACGQSLELQR